MHRSTFAECFSQCRLMPSTKKIDVFSHLHPCFAGSAYRATTDREADRQYGRIEARCRLSTHAGKRCKNKESIGRRYKPACNRPAMLLLLLLLLKMLWTHGMVYTYFEHLSHKSPERRNRYNTYPTAPSQK